MLAKPALYLSDFFERNKTSYIDHLMAVRQGNHMREWLIFFLHGVEETAHSAIDVFRQILLLKARIEQEILPRFSHNRQDKIHILMRHLYANPVMDIKMVSHILNVTPKTANILITDLVQYELLHEITGQQRNRLFLFKEYINLFREN